MRGEGTGTVAVRRRSRVWPLNSPWWIPSINETSRRCRVEPEVRRVAASSVCGRNGKNIFQNMQGPKGRGKRLNWSDGKDGRKGRWEIEKWSGFFFRFLKRQDPPLFLAWTASATGANRGRWRTLWNSLWPVVQQWPGHPVIFCSPNCRPRAPHLSLLHHP